MVGSANKHRDVPGHLRPCLDHRDRPLALVQPGIHAASSEAGARRHWRYSHASTDSFSAAKGPDFLSNFQHLCGASAFRYPLVPLIWRSSISPQVHVMSHHFERTTQRADVRSASVADWNWNTAQGGNTERTLTAVAGPSPRGPYRHALVPPRTPGLEKAA